MKRTFVPVILAVLMVAGAAYGKGFRYRPTPGDPASKPDWLAIEVTTSDEGVVQVILRMPSRERIEGYALKLSSGKSSNPALYVPVALTKHARGFAALLKLPKTLALDCTLSLDELLKGANGGSMCVIDLKNYVAQESHGVR